MYVVEGASDGDSGGDGSGDAGGDEGDPADDDVRNDGGEGAADAGGGAGAHPTDGQEQRWADDAVAAAGASPAPAPTSIDALYPDWCLSPLEVSDALAVIMMRASGGSRTICVPEMLASLNELIGDPWGAARRAAP
eukprot:6044480-Prymnesium_polylepis.1